MPRSSRSPVLLLAAAALVAASIVAPAVAPASPAEAAVSTSRLAGADRYATSVAVSRATPARNEVVFLVSGVKFPDALAAAPVAARERAHLLLTHPDRVPDSVMRELARLEPAEIVIVGSEASISDAVRQQLWDSTGARLTRIGGRDRVETSLLLLRRLERADPMTRAWLVSGRDFPDALVAASVAGATGGGIVLSWHGTGPGDAAAWADRLAPYVIGVPLVVAGGTPSVPSSDVALLEARGALDTVRLAGANRYETAIAINRAFPPAGDPSSILLATGERFPDALSGAVLSALAGTPLYLSPSQCSGSVTPLLASVASSQGYTATIGLGSAAALSDAALRLGPC